jgi:hypothetical protein
VDYILEMLPETEPSLDELRTIAAYLVAHKHGTPEDMDDAMTVVRRVVAACSLPED